MAFVGLTTEQNVRLFGRDPSVIRGQDSILEMRVVLVSRLATTIGN